MGARRGVGVRGALTTGTSCTSGALTMRDVIKILTLGSQLRRHARSSIEILREVDAIIAGRAPPYAAFPTDEQPPS